jgi:membrane-associated phospholipid phosphatase
MSPFDRLLAVMTRLKVAILYIGLVALSFFYLDKPIAQYFYAIDLKENLPFLSWLTKLGLGLIYMVGFFILALFFRYIRQNHQWEVRVWFLLMCATIPGVMCVFLKVLLGRARPDMWFSEQLYGFFGFKTNAYFWSFPSGHATTIIGVALGLGIVFPRYFYAFILAGLTVALSRVFLTHHYLSDVMAGSYLTLLEVGILLCVLRRKLWLVPAWRNSGITNKNL